MQSTIAEASESIALRTGGAAPACRASENPVAAPGDRPFNALSIPIGRRIRSSFTPSKAPFEPVLRQVAAAPQAALADSPTSDVPDGVWPADMTAPTHAHPVQWEQAVGLARTICARLYRDGGGPADALCRFGLEGDAADWDRAVRAIATHLCARSLPMAA